MGIGYFHLYAGLEASGIPIVRVVLKALHVDTGFVVSVARVHSKSTPQTYLAVTMILRTMGVGGVIAFVCFSSMEELWENFGLPVTAQLTHVTSIYV